ncbi:MAG: hypothetical protein NWQ15_08970 [Flavobacterium sp.]|jgi:hypothetical protein|nr:hypothetical protein [Flavobacterium sp.]MDP5098330.1 hypothetical protein [Flavobacterium sp.]
MSGHFFAFKNREKISKSKKIALRESISNKKSSLIGDNLSQNDKNLEHSEISKTELKKIKQHIRQTTKNRKRKQDLLFGISFLLLTILLLFLSKKYNVF